MKLHEVEMGSNIKLKDSEGNMLCLKFHYVDGMCSHCTDSKGNVINVAAWAEVEVSE